MIYAWRGVSLIVFRPMDKFCEIKSPPGRKLIPIAPSRRPELINSQLRPMRKMDLENVLLIEQRTHDFPWTKEMFEDCLQFGYYCWVCAEPDNLHGYGVMMLGADECHILNLSIAPEFQRKGLGRYLLTHLLYLGRRNHADTAFLEVRSSNVIALQLYLNLGFNEIGLRRAYYPAPHGREDAIILARSL